jgi:hypothetical protein
MPFREEFTRRSLFPRGEFESVMMVSASHLGFLTGRLATDFRLPRAAVRPLLADGEESVGGDSPSCGFGAGHGDGKTGSSIDDRGDERVLLGSMMSWLLPACAFSASTGGPWHLAPHATDIMTEQISDLKVILKTHTLCIVDRSEAFHRRTKVTRENALCYLVPSVFAMCQGAALMETPLLQVIPKSAATVQVGYLGIATSHTDTMVPRAFTGISR